MFDNFITKYTDIFCWKMREAFALQKLLTFILQKYWKISDIKVWNFNKMLTNNAVNFEQPGPDLQQILFLPGLWLDAWRYELKEENSSAV